MSIFWERKMKSEKKLTIDIYQYCRLVSNAKKNYFNIT